MANFSILLSVTLAAIFKHGSGFFKQNCDFQKNVINFWQNLPINLQMGSDYSYENCASSGMHSTSICYVNYMNITN